MIMKIEEQKSKARDLGKQNHIEYEFLDRTKQET